MSHEDILKAYPELEREDLNEAIEYASWLASDYHCPLNISKLVDA